MKEFLAVLSYTFKENMRKKVFIISTIIIVVLVAAIISVPGIINATSGKEKNEASSTGKANEQRNNIIYVIDSKKIFIKDIKKLGVIFPGYSFRAESQNHLADLKDKVSKDESVSIIVINEVKGIPYLDYYVKTYGKGLSPDLLSSNFKKMHSTKVLRAAGVDDKIAALAEADVFCQVKELGKGMMKSYMSSIIISMLLFFAIYFFGYGVSMSVASEKTSRVMEILVTSTRPVKIILGKSVAMGLLGLCQLTAVMLAAMTSYKLTFPKDFTIGGQRIDFSGFTPYIVFMIIVYFLLGYALYAMMNAAAGATVSKAEDMSSAIMPVSMVLMISFYFAYFTLMFPNGNVSIAASIIPFSAPFSMPCRLISTAVPLWQILASLTSMVVTTILIAWLSIKIYSSAVLHYGKRLKIKDLVNMSKLSS